MSEEYLNVARAITGRLVELPENDLALFASILTKKYFEKGEIVLDKGQVSYNMLHVTRGLLRQYYYKNNKDVTEYFVPEGESSLSCIESLFKQRASFMIIETLMNSEVYFIPYRDLIQLSHEHPLINKWMRLSLERALIISQEKADAIRFESAKERYIRFIKDYPHIIKYAPLSHIASYLLMTPESLSRVRADIFEKHA